MMPATINTKAPASVALTSNNRLRNICVEARASGTPIAIPPSVRMSASLRTIHTTWPPRSQRHSHADLAGPFGDRIGQASIQSNGRDQQREPAKPRTQTGHHALIYQSRVHAVIKRIEGPDWNVARRFAKFTPYCGR